ncbi:MAG: hypothetical protein IJS81_09195 [Selenomonadaceae bacterium]|nr:hypothetical protein [Selenomonadaceae bacterium]
MAQGTWFDQNFVTDSPLLPRTRRAYVPNGYSTAPPSYNPYSMQFMRTDYTQPIQTSQTPINQALTENFQPQYIQATDYNGQPVRVPANALKQAADYVPDVLKWGAGQLAENALIKNLTGKSLGDWAVLGARRAAPKIAGAMVGGPIGAAIPWIPEAVEGTKYLLSTPAAKTLGNGIKNVINWGF